MRINKALTPAMNIRQNYSQKFKHNEISHDNITYDSQRFTDYDAPLKISDFKADEHQMSKEMKDRIMHLRKKYKKVNEEFLNLFEKRYLIFIEDGADLKKDCNIF